MGETNPHRDKEKTRTFLTRKLDRLNTVVLFWPKNSVCALQKISNCATSSTRRCCTGLDACVTVCVFEIFRLNQMIGLTFIPESTHFYGSNGLYDFIYSVTRNSGMMSLKIKPKTPWKSMGFLRMQKAPHILLY